jgi:hypothetical protein
MALIYVTQTRDRADVKVHITENRANADLFAFKVESRDLARDHDEGWCEVDILALADVRCLFVDSIRAADLVVHFVSSRGLAGWRKPHDLNGKLAG